MHFFAKIFLCIALTFEFKCAAFSQDTLRFSSSTTEKLNYPYGTILTMQVEIFDGEQLKDLFHSSSFLFRIKSVNDTILKSSVLIEFKDDALGDSAYLPNDIIELREYFYGTDSQIRNKSRQNTPPLKPKYVGRTFTIVGYESGEFMGSPSGIGKYRALGSTIFHFRHYIVVVAKVFDNDWYSLKGSLKK